MNKPLHSNGGGFAGGNGGGGGGGGGGINFSVLDGLVFCFLSHKGGVLIKAEKNKGLRISPYLCKRPSPWSTSPLRKLLTFGFMVIS